MISQNMSSLSLSFPEESYIVRPSFVMASSAFTPFLSMSPIFLVSLLMDVVMVSRLTSTSGAA